MVTTDEVMNLVVGRIAAVMAIDPATVSGDSRFDEDLHADSLDLVEVIEGVERDLSQRGHQLALSDEELLSLRTVAEAAQRIAGTASPTGEGATS